jgi:hypothetical protein
MFRPPFVCKQWENNLEFLESPFENFGKKISTKPNVKVLNQNDSRNTPRPIDSQQKT